MQCRLCETRRARRYCPAVRADICPVCCGNEREVTLDCPLDCMYLQEARKHERVPEEAGDGQFPNQDIRVTESFINERQDLLIAIGGALARAALETPGAVDSDAREALESLIRTYRTAQTGLVYETRPSNPIAGAIHERLQLAFQEYREAVAQESGMHPVRDADILGVLAFLQRVGIRDSNGRRRGRAFIDRLRGFLSPDKAAAPRPLIQI